MKKQMIVLLVLSVLLVLFAASCSSADSDVTTLYPEDGGRDAATLFAEECSKCHALDLVKQVSFDADQWEAVVDRMVIKGAALSDEEKAMVTEYLIGKYAK